MFCVAAYTRKSNSDTFLSGKNFSVITTTKQSQTSQKDLKSAFYAAQRKNNAQYFFVYETNGFFVCLRVINYGIRLWVVLTWKAIGLGL